MSVRKFLNQSEQFYRLNMIEAVMLGLLVYFHEFVGPALRLGVIEGHGFKHFFDQTDFDMLISFDLLEFI